MDFKRLIIIDICSNRNNLDILRVIIDKLMEQNKKPETDENT